MIFSQIITSILLFSSVSMAQPTQIINKPARVTWLSQGIEISGILKNKKNTYTIVADKATEPYYQINTKTAHLKELEWPKIKGFDDYIARTANQFPKIDASKRWDTEGLAQCGSKVYIINERVREVLEINTETQSIRLLPIAFNDFIGQELNKGGGNAGFEGVAVDCKNQVLYVAKERDPKFIIVIDLKTLEILKEFDFDGSIEIPESTKQFPASQDIADLYFDQGYLYVLERNAHMVSKVDPHNFEVVARVNFKNLEVVPGLKVTEVFATGEPYGLAEALHIEPATRWKSGKIVIGFDANESKLTPKAKALLKIKSEAPALIVELKKPKGF